MNKDTDKIRQGKSLLGGEPTSIYGDTLKERWHVRKAELDNAYYIAYQTPKTHPNRKIYIDKAEEIMYDLNDIFDLQTEAQKIFNIRSEEDKKDEESNKFIRRIELDRVFTALATLEGIHESCDNLSIEEIRYVENAIDELSAIKERILGSK